MTRKLTDATRRRCRRAALAAADWYVASQCTCTDPFSDANVGRFLYNYHRPTQAPIWGLSWTQARGIFVLLNAWQLTRKPAYSVAIQRGALYLKALQKLDPRRPEFYGAIPEAVPVEHFCYPRDAAEAAEALVLMYRMTRQSEWLERARITANWFADHVIQDGWPATACYFDTGEFKRTSRGCWQLGAGKLFYQLYRIDRDRKAYERIIRPLCDVTLDELQRPDGSMIPSVPTPVAPDHHTGGPDELDVCYNEDGAGVVLLGAYRVLKERRYLDAAVALGDWMTTRSRPFPSHVTPLNFSNLLLDLHRLTRRPRYQAWVLDHLDDILSLQVRRSGDANADGAFAGEDEPTKWYFGGAGTDYVNTRNTAYAALALFKLDGEAFGPGYSIHGWRPIPRLPELLPNKALVLSPRKARQKA